MNAFGNVNWVFDFILFIAPNQACFRQDKKEGLRAVFPRSSVYKYISWIKNFDLSYFYPDVTLKSAILHHVSHDI